MTPAAVRWAEVQRPLTLFAQGLAGRTVALGPLPAEMAVFDTRRQNLGAWRVLVLRRLGQIEAAGALPAAGRGSWPRLLRGVFGWLETLRIDAALIRRYPGATADLARVRAATLARLLAGGAMPAAPAGPVVAAVLRLRRHALGVPLSGRPQPSGEAWQPWVDSLLAEQAGPRHSLAVALRICHWLGATAPARGAAGPALWPLAPAADIGEPGAAMQQRDAAGAEGADLMAADLTLLGAEAQQGAGQGGALATAAVPAAAGPADPGAAASQRDHPAAGAGARADGPPARQRFMYDEWNHLEQRYLPGWCQVHEQRLQGDEVGYGREVRRRHAALARQVRRQFGAIRPEAWQRVHRTRDGDEFELDALVDAVVERHAGRIGDERLYLWRERAAREVAAAFLVDMSASTDFPVPDPDAAPPPPLPAPALEDEDEHPMLYGGWFGAPPPAAQAPAPKRRVIDVAKESLALMCDALQLLGDRHAVYGFSGRGRENVEFWVAKDFREALTGRTWAALAAMQPRGATRMGAAVRHALAKLAREPARLKLLIIVSDGYPQDSDYGPKPAGRGGGADDAEYGIQDTAQALREAERAGVIPFHVTIDPAGHDYLRRMCAEHRYLVIDDVRALPEALGKVYRALAT